MQLDPHVPVLALPGNVIQVGLASPAVLAGLGSDERAFVASLEGGSPIPPEHARRFRKALSRLTSAGVEFGGVEFGGAEFGGVEFAVPGATALTAPMPTSATPTTPSIPPAEVAVHGCGALGMAIATSLTVAGYAVSMRDDASSIVEPTGVYLPDYAGTCAGAAVATLATRDVRVRADSGSAADLAVVLCTGAPDPVVVRQLLRDDTPHVLVVCSERPVWVSHVVVPGVSACSRCRDLALTDANPQWPFVALQLAGSPLPTRRPHATTLAQHVVAGLVVERLSEWLCQYRFGEATRVDGDGGVTREPLAPRADCGCGAFGPVGDELAARRAVLR